MILKFKDIGNKHVYTSVNGSSWTSLTTLDNMYGNSITLDYSYFYDVPAGTAVYTLVYSSDIDYEDEPLYIPDFNGITDITGKLHYDINDILELVHIYELVDSGNIRDHFDLGTEIGSVVASSLSALFSGDFNTFYKMAQKGLNSEVEYLKAFIDSYEQQMIIDSFTKDYVGKLIIGDDGNYELYQEISFYGLQKVIYQSISNIDTRLDVYMLDVHNDLKSVFDNISVTNTYLYDIKKMIKDFPNYSKDIKELKAAIDNIDVSVTVPDINIPDYSRELERIQSLLENMDVNVNVSVPSGGDLVFDIPKFDDTDIVYYLSDISTTIKLMNSPVGVDDVVDIFDGLSDDEGMLDIGNFVMNAIATIHTGKVLNMAFTYMGSLSDGIGWINGHVQSIFDVSGVFRGVLLLGVTLFTVNLIVRRDG